MHSSVFHIEEKRYLREKPYWGNHFWAKGYFVSTIGLDSEKIKQYIKYQEEIEKQQEQENKSYKLF